MDREIMIQRKEEIIMKTAEEILNEILIDVEDRPVFFKEQDVADLIGQVQKEAYKEGQSNPKVKKLEWTEGTFFIIANTPFGEYRIPKNLSANGFIVYFSGKSVAIGYDINEAKQLAKDNFEQKVRECLITE